MPLFSAVENQVSLILCLSRSAVELGGEMMTQSTVACMPRSCGNMGLITHVRRSMVVRGTGWRVGGVAMGLTLCPACESGDKDCALTTGTLTLSIHLADDYADSIQNSSDNLMRLGILHLDEEPESTAHCTQFPTEVAVVFDHDLNLNKSFEVPSGWTCAFTDGSYSTTRDGESVLTYCGGYLAPIEVPGCSDVEESMVVTCEEQQDEGD